MTDGVPSLAGAAENVRNVFDRVWAGVVTQVAEAAARAGLDAARRRDLVDLLAAAAERARFTRVAIPQLLGEHQVPPIQGGVRSSWLPLNRKERFYTGTVLPMLVASDGFAHLGRLTKLCGLPDVQGDSWGSLELLPDLAFFTEYGFAESVFTDADREAWPELVEGDTPDVVIAGADWLLAIEAKMFHNPSASSLNRQMERQRALVDYWSRRRGLDPARVRHVLLLPQPLAKRVGPLAYDVVTWEEVHDLYQAVAPRYWSDVLAAALGRHPELQSRLDTGGTNAEAKMTGADILAQHADGGLGFNYVGRSGGLAGEPFAKDIATGGWRTVRYEVRTGGLPGNRNWFAVADFIARTAEETTAGDQA